MNRGFSVLIETFAAALVLALRHKITRRRPRTVRAAHAGRTARALR